MRNMKREVFDAKPSASIIAEDDGTPLRMQARIPAAKAKAVQTEGDPGFCPSSAFRAWSEIRARLRAADYGAVLLDFDGTLVNLRRRPSDVRMPAQARRILEGLVQHTSVFVAIVSGRRVQALRSLVGVAGLHYFGLHGAERDDKSATLSKAARLALEGAKRAAQLQLSVVPGIWIEDKDLSFSVHHRDADATASESGYAALVELLATWGNALHVLNGSRVWEVLPSEIPGKSSAVEEVLGELPAAAAVV
jgi:trehalose-phosphatase